VPSPPKFTFDNITDSQFTLIWDPPKHLPGNLEEFEMTITWTVQYPIPNWCARESKNSIKYNVSGSIFDYTYLEAKAYTMYTVNMRARTGAGWSEHGFPQNIITNSIGIYYIFIFSFRYNKKLLSFKILSYFYAYLIFYVCYFNI